MFIGSNGNIGIGTGAVNCNVNVICLINEDVDHHMPTQVYFGWADNPLGGHGSGATNVSWSTKVVMVPGTKDAPNNNRYEFGMSLGLMV